jgi:adenylyltransferase/sulfurtransferase
VPLNRLVANPSEFLPEAGTDTYIVCRLGNDSQIAVEALRSVSQEGAVVKDIVGGLKAWSRDVDPMFPVY